MATKQLPKKFSEWTDEQLINYYKELHSCINISECFSTSDLMNYDNMEIELIKRGYEVKETTHITVQKKIEEEG